MTFISFHVIPYIDLMTLFLYRILQENLGIVLIPELNLSLEHLNKRRTGNIFSIIFAVMLLIYFGVSSLVVTFSRVPRLELTGSPVDMGLKYENVTFPNRTNDVLLSGWYLPGEKDTIIIMVTGGFHNRIDSRTGTLEIARELVERGFNVLKFDLQERGTSEGKGRLLTYDERDIGGAIDFVQSLGYAPGNIVLMGFSAGAKSSLVTASRNEVGAVIADSSFVHVINDTVRKVSMETGAPQFIIRLFMPVMELIAKVMYGYDVADVSRIVVDVSSPILFIYGEDDDLVTMDGARSLYAASANPADEFWILPGARHSQAYRHNPIEYIDRVETFIIRVIETSVVSAKTVKQTSCH